MSTAVDDAAASYDPRARGAVRLAMRAFQLVREERARKGVFLDQRIDPGSSGLIGLRDSPVTTVRGDLEAKQISTNPQWAGAVVQLLERIGLKAGDVVAAGFSGSFPGLNIAVLAAAQAMELRLIVISSVGASQYGANLPELLWPDIERLLLAHRLFKQGSVAMSRGGRGDHALELLPAHRKRLDAAIERCGYSLIYVHGRAQNVTRRMLIYEEQAQGEEIRAYINVGGSAVSAGGRRGKRAFKPGLNFALPGEAARIDSVMNRFAARGVPVLHLIRLRELAARLKLLSASTLPP